MTVQLMRDETEEVWNLVIFLRDVPAQLEDWQKSEIKRLAREINVVARYERKEEAS